MTLREIKEELENNGDCREKDGTEYYIQIDTLSDEFFFNGKEEEVGCLSAANMQLEKIEDWQQDFKNLLVEWCFEEACSNDVVDTLKANDACICKINSKAGAMSNVGKSRIFRWVKIRNIWYVVDFARRRKR